MNREEIINTLKKYSFDIKRYIVISGTAMVLHGLKDETNDIDLSVTPDYEEELLEDYLAVLEHTNPNGSHAYMINGIINFGPEYYTENREFIGEIPVQTIKNIIEIKKKLYRDKDKKDLELIYRRLQ
ncbi:MAG: hypothetical protein IKR57_04385 [Bacilli bacterium]|nr:hypothetical protein [Bacilli bacterium]